MGGRLPLHCAALWRLDILRVVRVLVAAWPDALRVGDREGRRPLHYAALRGKLALARFLAAAWPSGLHTGDNEGRLPLHLFVMHCWGTYAE
jgi:ankyrin repeat protein